MERGEVKRKRPGLLLLGYGVEASIRYGEKATGRCRVNGIGCFLSSLQTIAAGVSASAEKRYISVDAHVQIELSW